MTVALGSVHVRVEGRSYDFDMDELDISFESSDIDIKRAVAAATEVPVTKLNAYEIERNTLENYIDISPGAVFGKSC